MRFEHGKDGVRTTSGDNPLGPQASQRRIVGARRSGARCVAPRVPTILSTPPTIYPHKVRSPYARPSEPSAERSGEGRCARGARDQSVGTAAGVRGSAWGARGRGAWRSRGWLGLTGPSEASEARRQESRSSSREPKCRGSVGKKSDRHCGVSGASDPRTPDPDARRPVPPAPRPDDPGSRPVLQEGLRRSCRGPGPDPDHLRPKKETPSCEA